MNMVSGGLRKRLIKDNFYLMLRSGLEYYGWFDDDTKYSLELLPKRLDPDEEIVPNKISISAEDLTTSEAELGSNLENDEWDIYIDIYAESEDIGINLLGDVLDTVRGKIPEIGRTGREFNVYNLETEDQEYLFACDIINIASDRSKDASKPYLKYYWVVLCSIRDSYY